MTPTDIILHLHLQPHPEGGFYKETYRSPLTSQSPEQEPRNVSTAIYYMLQHSDKSHFHRIKSDECWFFHQGEPLEILSIQLNELVRIVLGNNLLAGEMPQAMIPAGTWFAAKIKEEKGYALVSCTVAPGFDFADFEMAKREELLSEFPHIAGVIEEFTVHENEHE